MRVALVSCVKSKRATPSPAKDLYTSELFQRMRKYAESISDRWYILSAEHGVLEPDQVISPYECTLNRMDRAARLRWADRVKAQLVDKMPERAEVIVLAGERYRNGLLPFLRDLGHTVRVPLEGLSFGRQLQRLGELLSTETQSTS